MTSNETASYDLTILVPVYNEEDNMAALSSRLAAYLPRAKMSSCVLFINDGSTDRSGERIREACAGHEGFFYIELSCNTGLSSALKAGMDQVRSPYLAYIDADLQTAPEELDLLTPYLGDYELVTGVRARRKDTGFKKIQSRIANGFRRMMIKDGARDTGCPLKVMRADMARALPFFKGMHRFFPALIQLEGRPGEADRRVAFPARGGRVQVQPAQPAHIPLRGLPRRALDAERHIAYKVKADNLRHD